VPPSRRIEDRIRLFVRKLTEIDESSDDFDSVAAELRFALFTLRWQIQTGLKNYPPELDRRRKAPDSFD
jgi:ribosomal protein L29